LRLCGADIPPRRGVFKGQAHSKLTVSVRVAPSDSMPEMEDEFRLSADWEQAQQQQQLRAGLDRVSRGRWRS
jgi:hypothetical protein